MHDGSSNRLNHALPVCNDIVIVEPQYLVTLGCEECIALCVALDVFRFVMLSTVYFDNEQCRLAYEIDDERTNRGLAPEAHAVHPMSADRVPDNPFCIGHVAAKPGRAGALLG